MPRSKEEIAKAAEERRQRVEKILNTDNNVIAFLESKKLNNKEGKDAILAAFDVSVTENMVKDPGSMDKNYSHTADVVFADVCTNMMYAHKRALLKVLGVQSVKLYDEAFYGTDNQEQLVQKARDNEKKEQQRIERTAKSQKTSNIYTTQVMPILSLVYEAIDQDRERYPEESREDTRRAMKNFRIEPVDEETKKNLRSSGAPIRDLAGQEKQQFTDMRQLAVEKIKEEEINRNFSGDSGSFSRWSQVLLGKPGLSPEEREQIIGEMNNHDAVALLRRYMRELRNMPIDKFGRMDMKECFDDFDEMYYYAGLAMDSDSMYKSITPNQAAELGEDELKLFREFQQNALLLGSFYKEVMFGLSHPVSEVFAFEQVKGLEEAGELFANQDLRGFMTAIGIAHADHVDALQNNFRKTQEALKALNEKYPLNVNEPGREEPLNVIHEAEPENVIHEAENAAQAGKANVSRLLETPEMKAYLAKYKLNDPAKLDAIKNAMDDSVTENMVKSPGGMTDREYGTTHDRYEHLCEELRKAHFDAMLEALDLTGVGIGDAFAEVFYKHGKYEDMLAAAQEAEKNEQRKLQKIAERTKKPVRENKITEKVMPVLPILYEAMAVDMARYPEKSMEDARGMLKNFKQMPVDDPKALRGKLKEKKLPVRGLKKADAAHFRNDRLALQGKLQEKMVRKHFPENSSGTIRWAQGLLEKPGLAKEERDQIVADMNNGNMEPLFRRYLQELRNFPTDKFKNMSLSSILNNFDEMAYYAQIAMDSESMLDDLKVKSKAYSKEEQKLYKDLKDSVMSSGGMFFQMVSGYVDPMSEVYAFEKLDSDRNALKGLDIGGRIGLFAQTITLNFVTNKNTVEQDLPRAEEVKKQLNQKYPMKAEEPGQEKHFQEKSAVKQDQSARKEEGILNRLKNDKNLSSEQKKAIRAGFRNDGYADIIKGNRDGKYQTYGPLFQNASRDLTYMHLRAVLNVVGVQEKNEDWNDLTKFSHLMHMDPSSKEMSEAVNKLESSMPDKMKPAMPYILEAVRLDRQEYTANRGRAKQMYGNLVKGKKSDTAREEIAAAGIPLVNGGKNAKGIQTSGAKAEKAVSLYSEWNLNAYFSGENAPRWMGMLQHKPGISQKERDEIAHEANTNQTQKLAERYMKELRSIPLEKINKLTPDYFLEHYDEMRYYQGLFFEVDTMLGSVRASCPELISDGQDKLYLGLRNNMQTRLNVCEQITEAMMNPATAQIDFEQISRDMAKKDGPLEVMNKFVKLAEGSTKVRDIGAALSSAYYSMMEDRYSFDQCKNILEELDRKEALKNAPKEQKAEPEEKAEQARAQELKGDKAEPAGPQEEKIEKIDQPDVQEEKIEKIDQPDVREEKIEKIDQPDVQEEKIEKIDQAAPQEEKIEPQNQADDGEANQGPVEADNILFDLGGMRENVEPALDVRNYPATSAIGRMRIGEEGMLPSDQVSEGLREIDDDDMKKYLDLNEQLRKAEKPLTKADWKRLSLSLAVLENQYKPTEGLTADQEKLPENEKKTLIGIKNILRADRNILERVGGQLSEKIEGRPVKPMTFTHHVMKAKSFILKGNPRKGGNQHDLDYAASLNGKIEKKELERIKSGLAKADLGAWIFAQEAARAMDKMEWNKTLPGVDWFDSSEFTAMKKKVYEIAAHRPDTYQDMRKAMMDLRIVAGQYLNAKHEQRKGEAFGELGRKREQFAKEVVDMSLKWLKEMQGAMPEKNASDIVKTATERELTVSHGHSREHHVTFQQVFAARARSEAAVKGPLSLQNAEAYARYLVLDDLIDNEREEEISRVTKEELDRRIAAVEKSPAMDLMINSKKRLCSDLVTFNKCNSALNELQKEKQRLYEMNIFTLAQTAEKPDPKAAKKFRTGVSKVDKLIDAERKQMVSQILRERKDALSNTYAKSEVEDIFRKAEDLSQYEKTGRAVVNIPGTKFQLMKDVIVADAAEAGAPKQQTETAVRGLKNQLSAIAREGENQKAVGEFLAGGMMKELGKIASPEKNRFVENFVQKALANGRPGKEAPRKDPIQRGMG